jgi:multidrug efflux pump subunit AcrB
MRLSHFFIDRPVFAGVIAILITLIGAIAYPNLPISQYPNIAPPTVVVSASYPGASAETLADTVAAPIEEQINGVEDMLYMSSQSTGDGASASPSPSRSAQTPTRRRCWSRTGSRPRRPTFRPKSSPRA